MIRAFKFKDQNLIPSWPYLDHEEWTREIRMKRETGFVEYKDGNGLGYIKETPEFWWVRRTEGN